MQKKQADLKKVGEEKEVAEIGISSNKIQERIQILTTEYSKLQEEGQQIQKRMLQIEGTVSELRNIIEQAEHQVDQGGE